MVARLFEWVDSTLRPMEPPEPEVGGIVDGAYTTLRTYGGDRIVRLAAHVRRLEQSSALKGESAALDPSAVRNAVAAALQATGYPESRLRLTFAPPRLLVWVEPFTPVPAALYEKGVACVTLPLRRDNPHAKDTRFMTVAARSYDSLPPGTHEGLLVAADGVLLEGLSSNFFALLAGVLHCERERALQGITGAMAQEVARDLTPLSPLGVRREDLPSVTECFLTSASRGVLPVVSIDGKAVGEGAPGPLTSEVMRRFDDLVWREAVSVS